MRQSKYSQEFKNSTVELIINNNESVVKVAEDLDLNPKTLYHWVTMYKKAHKIPTKSINSSSSKESESEELKRLRHENKILKQERDLNLKVKMKRRYKNTTDSNHNLPIAPNILNRDFYASNPNEKYVGDITYIPTGEGWLYLATVIDLYSRKVVGWSMDDTMKVSLVNDALNMAIIHRSPSPGLLWHTDRGSQYASYSHKDLLEKYNIIQSMSRKGNCWDNSVAESFFKSLKQELVYNTYFYTKKQAKKEIFEYIEFYYNRVRTHSYLGNLSPVKFEEKQKMLQNEMVA